MSHCNESSIESAELLNGLETVLVDLHASAEEVGMIDNQNLI